MATEEEAKRIQMERQKTPAPPPVPPAAEVVSSPDAVPPPVPEQPVAQVSNGNGGLPDRNSGSSASGPQSAIVPAASTALTPPSYPKNLPEGIPTRMEDILDLIGEGKTIWDALTTVFGLHDVSYKYLILERTRLTKEEANVVSDAIFVAEHGIGVPPFDFPMPMFADWVVAKLHAFISVDGGKGNARDEFREIASSWVASLRAKAALQQGIGGGVTGAAVVDRGVPGSEP
jgi:hypothetical protein